jgi:hypothetical protein
MDGIGVVGSGDLPDTLVEPDLGEPPALAMPSPCPLIGQAEPSKMPILWQEHRGLPWSMKAVGTGQVGLSDAPNNTQ